MAGRGAQYSWGGVVEPAVTAGMAEAIMAETEEQEARAEPVQTLRRQ